MGQTEPIGEGDIQTLLDAREANPAWFAAILLGAETMAERRKKWSGQTGPFANFIRWAQMNQARVEDTFRWATTLKMTRDQDSEALEDSLIDNAIDKVNYPALGAGWMLMSPEDKLAAMLELGPWIDSSLLKNWDVIDGPQD